MESDYNPQGGITDFKVLCFHGKPELIIVDWDRFIDHKRNFFTPQWQKMDIAADDSVTTAEPYPRPENLEEMLRVASILSADFPFVRVDLYNIKGKIFFGELTFYPWSGYVKFTPDKFDFELGSKFDLTTMHRGGGR